RCEKLISFAKLGLLRSSTRMAGRSLLAPGATEVGQIWHFSSLQQMRFSQRYRCYQACNLHSHTQFRVELSVDDGNDNATFVVFDMEKTKLTKRDASDLGHELNYQHVLKSLLERNNTCHFIYFHIKPSYLHQSSSNNQAPVVEGEGGETAASASNTAAAGDDEPNPPGFEAIENSRKRTRE
ncbi:unnamed protein product, partial [Brassica oleracea]